MAHEAVVSPDIQQFRTELKWLRKLQRELPHRRLRAILPMRSSPKNEPKKR